MSQAAFTVDASKSGKAELLKKLAKVKNIGAGLKVAAHAVGILLRGHFRSKDQKEPNKLGGDRTHYWLQVMRSVNAPKQVGKEHVTLAISDPTITQKIFGGIIRAKNAKALTIPIHRDAHGRRASVLESKIGKKLFRVKDLLAASGEDGKLTFYYVLRKSVKQKADPTALPPGAEIERAFTGKLSEWMGR